MDLLAHLPSNILTTDEGDEVDACIFDQLRRFGATGVDNADHTGRHAGGFEEFDQTKAAQLRLTGRLDQYAVARREGSAELMTEQIKRVIKG